jgi:membrane protein implicated in regulation of membrane protease activity
MTDEQPGRDDHPFFKFLVASTPGWLIAVVAVVMLSRWGEAPLWVLLVLLAVWILTDIAMFPRRRHYYVSELPTRRIIGEHGIALSELAPRGLVRVHGERWQAEAADGAIIHEGGALRVREVDGLVLFVEPLEHPPSALPSHRSSRTSLS